MTPDIASDHPAPVRWRHAVAGKPGVQRHRVFVWLAAAILPAALAVSLAPVWATLHSQWTGVATYSHGYLLAAVAAALVWRRWHAAPPKRLTPSWRDLAGVAVLLIALALLELLFLNVPRLFLLPPLLLACVATVFGRDAAAIVAWPVLLLYLALPVWAGINGILQSITTGVVSTVLDWIGVPVFIQGNFVQIPAGLFEVAEGCSGLRYLVVATTLAALYGLAFLKRGRDRGLLLAVAAVSAIVCNWVRVFTIIFVGHLTDMQHYLIVEEHISFGWLVFGLSLIPVLWTAGRLSRRHGSAPGRSAASSGPLIDSRGVLAASAVVAALLIGTRVGLSAAVGDAAMPPVPVAGRGAMSADASGAPWQPVFANAFVQRRTWADRQPAVEAFVAAYPRQSPTRRLIAYGNSFEGAEWRAVAEREVTVRLGSEPLAVRELEGYLDGKRRLIWAWYSIAGGTATGPIGAKLLELEGLLKGRRDAAAIAVSAVCEPGCEAARERLRAFLEDSGNGTGWLQ